MSFKSTTSLLSKAFSLTALLTALAAPALAQTVVTGVTWSVNSSAPSTTGSDGVTYQNDVARLTSVTTATGTYDWTVLSESSTVFVRTSNSSGTSSTVYWEQQTASNNTSILGTQLTGMNSSANVAAKLTEANGFSAIKNTFDNDRAGGVIERIDVYFGAAGYVVNPTDVLIFFDFSRTENDNLRIVPFTSLNTSTGVATYATRSNGNIAGITINDTQWGTNNKLNTPDGLSTNADPDGDGTPGLNYRETTISANGTITSRADDIFLTALVVTMADLGLVAGTTIQGFSVMATDVTTNNNLNSWTNGAFFPQDSDATNSSVQGFGEGGADFIGFWSPARRNVPEPSTYGAIAAAGALGFLAWRRRRKLAAPSAA